MKTEQTITSLALAIEILLNTPANVEARPLNNDEIIDTHDKISGLALELIHCPNFGRLTIERTVTPEYIDMGIKSHLVLSMAQALSIRATEDNETLICIANENVNLTKSNNHKNMIIADVEDSLDLANRATEQSQEATDKAILEITNLEERYSALREKFEDSKDSIVKAEAELTIAKAEIESLKASLGVAQAAAHKPKIEDIEGIPKKDVMFSKKASELLNKGEREPTTATVTDIHLPSSLVDKIVEYFEGTTVLYARNTDSDNIILDIYELNTLIDDEIDYIMGGDEEGYECGKPSIVNHPIPKKYWKFIKELEYANIVRRYEDSYAEENY